MSASNIERQLVQANWAEYFGGDIAIESGRFACDALRNTNLDNLDAPLFEAGVKRDISNSIIAVRKDLWTDGPYYFKAGFNDMRDFAVILKLIIEAHPHKTTLDSTISDVHFQSDELYERLRKNQNGVGVMRYVRDRLKKLPNLTDRDTNLRRGNQAAVEFYEELTTSMANFCLDEINRVKNKPQ